MKIMPTSQNLDTSSVQELVSPWKWINVYILLIMSVFLQDFNAVILSLKLQH